MSENMRKIRIKVFFFAKDSRGGTDTFLKQMKLLNNGLFEKSYFYFKRERLVKYDENDFFLNESYPLELHFTFRKLALFFDNLTKAFSIIKSNHPDILFTCDVYSYTIVVIAKILHSKFKLVHFVNNNFYLIIKNRQAGAIYKNFILKTFKYLSSCSDVIIFASIGLKRFALNTMVNNSVRSQIIPNSVDVAKLKKLLKEPINKNERNHLLQKDVYKIMSVGRLDEQKDFATILKSFQKILIKKSNCVLIIIGDGYLRTSLEKLSRKLKISDKTYFLGWKENIYKYLKYADIFVFSSHYEGFAQVLIEAMACGVPVVATDSPFGPKEILQNGKYGIIVPVGDYKGLSEGAVKILSVKTLWNRYAKEGFKRAQYFETKKMLKRYEQLFLSISKINGL